MKCLCIGGNNDGGFGDYEGESFIEIGSIIEPPEARYFSKGEMGKVSTMEMRREIYYPIRITSVCGPHIVLIHKSMKDQDIFAILIDNYKKCEGNHHG